MNKGIKAQLYLSRADLDIICKHGEEMDNTFSTICYDIGYDIYASTYKDEEICAITVEMINSTFYRCEVDYTKFKKYIKKLTGHQPTQVFKLKYEVVQNVIMDDQEHIAQEVL